MSAVSKLSDKIENDPAVTVTVVLEFAVPPAPVQATEYVVVTVGETEDEPYVAPPVENPVPVQEAASVEDHESVEDWPEMILVGLAEREAVEGEVGVPVSHGKIKIIGSS